MMRISFAEPGNHYGFRNNKVSMISYSFFSVVIFFFVMCNFHYNFWKIIILGGFNARSIRKYKNAEIDFEFIESISLIRY